MALVDNPRILTETTRPARDLDLDLFAARVADACRQVTGTEAHQFQPRLAHTWPWPKPRSARSEFRESFRLLALSLEQLATSQPLKSILIMGARTGEGRTTVAANLALALAANGRRVVLLDADTRRPGLFKLFELQGTVNSTTGASSNGHNPTPDFPQGEAWPRVVSVPGMPGLALVAIEKGSAEPLDVHTATPLLAALRSVADFVVIDSPACATYADAFHLAPLAHGIVYVLRRRQQDADAQRRTSDMLGRLGASVLTVVFNDC